MRKRYVIFVVFMTAALAAGGILTAVMGHREFSENENRYLEQFPSLTLSGIADGEVQEDVVKAFNDQFPARDFWTAFSTRAEKMMGRRDIGGVYLGKNQYYFEKIMDGDISQTDYFQSLRFINHVQGLQEDAKVTALLVPSPATILSDYLPSHARIYDADAMYQSAEGVLAEGILLDMRDEMAAAAGEAQIYYKTDHHWTLSGAYVGYRTYVEAMGRQARPYADFGVETVSDSFYGTLYSKALDADAAPDTIDAPSRLPAASVQCDGQERDGIFDETKREQKDKYAYFFGGNYGEVILRPEGDGQEDKPKLLVVKDSFANSMIPFLLQDYSEIRMLDLRYFKTSFRDYLEEYSADEILILYEMSNFAQDNNMNKLMK